MLQSAIVVEASSDVAAARAKLTELERELALSKSVGDLQFQIDGLASQGFELEQKLSASEQAKAAVRSAQAAFDAAPSPESLGLGPDIVTRWRSYPQLVARRDEALAKLGSERAPEEEAPIARKIEPLWTDQPLPDWRRGGTAGAGRRRRRVRHRSLHRVAGHSRLRLCGPGRLAMG